MKQLQIVMTLCIVLLFSSLFAQSLSAQTCCVGAERGDADGSGEFDVSDVVYVVNWIFKDGPLPECLDELDVVIDGSGDVSDLVYLVNYLFKDGPAPPECPPSLPYVFIDEYHPAATYEAFDGSKLDAVLVDAVNKYAGSQGLAVTIPNEGEGWSGGAFTADVPQDLSTYNALTFWVKASMAATIDAAGIANDNTGTSKYTADVIGGIAVTTEWQKIVIPFPLAEKLSAEQGLFYFAEGPEGGLGYSIYMDEIIFEDLSTITNPRPDLGSQTVEVEAGATVDVGNGTVTFDVDGTDMTLSAMPAYFTFASSDDGVVHVGVDGVITATGVGTATLTADLGATAATGSVVVTVLAPDPVPTVAADAPTADPGDVVSLYSDTYSSATVDTWSAGWDDADVSDFVIGPDNMKKYSNLVFAGVEFTSATLDASAMTHFHMDVWTPEAAAGKLYKVKLVDFGPDGVWSGPGTDDVEHELVFDDNTMASQSWVGIDVPLVSFTNLVTRGHIAQMVISGDFGTVYVDNIYFYDDGLPTAPIVAAPTPSLDAGNVLSLYSDAYTPATTVETWSAVWDQADVEDFVVESDNTKKYSNMVFAGVEFVSSPLDASSMTHFHMDVWTPVPTAGALFKVKLVDFGTSTTEHEMVFDDVTMSTGSWVSIDVAIADMTGLAAVENLSQMIISGDLGTVYVDNIYFYVPAATAPTTSAPTPTADPGDVVSLYSDEYTDLPMTSWSFGWDGANLFDETVGSDNIMKYEYYGGYSVAEVTAPRADASSMTHFHMDIWTPDAVAGQVYNVKLVDFGADNNYDGGDDSEHELVFTDAELSTGSWVSIDVPLADFTGLASTAQISQLVFSGGLTTVFVDNIYFYAAPITAPTTSAPTPTADPGDVVSLYSDSYTDLTMSAWSFGWDGANQFDETVGSDNIMKFEYYGGYSVAEVAAPRADASAMTHFHMDVWTPDAVTGLVYNVKLVDFGADNNYDGGDDSEHELVFTDADLSTGTWVSIDVPLADFTSLASTAQISQLVFSSGLTTVFVDNIYFYASAATAPTTAAPSPTFDASSVKSLYSDVYTDETMGFWSPEWDGANVTDETADSDNVKKFDFFGGYSVSEIAAPRTDASSMTRFHIDVWTPEAVTGKSFKIKIVDFGADGNYDGGDDTEHELTFTDAVMSTAGWVSIDVPMTDFTGLTTTSHISQVVFSGDYGVVFMDNIYFYSDVPVAPATTPAYGAADVISLYSDAYTDVAMGFWSPEWDGANVTGEIVSADNMMKFDFFGGYSVSEIATPRVDASTMTHFTIDVWTPEGTAGKLFKIKLVDFGADGNYDGGDDSEHELTFDDTDLSPGGWVTLNIPMGDFSGLTATASMSQIVFSGDFGIVFFDNVMFHK